jgi:hypothetical protein
MSAEETYNVKHGGLMRCCLQSLDTEMLRRQRVKEPLTVEGDTHACQCAVKVIHSEIQIQRKTGDERGHCKPIVDFIP